MTLLFVYLLIALLFSFLCSIAEAVLLSVTPSYVEAQRERGRPAGVLLQQLKESVDRPLAAILSLNTIAHTVGAAGVGAQAQVVFQGRWVGATSAVLTLLILVFSEIIPKTLGAVYWRSLAAPVARGLQVLIWTMYPLVVLSERLTRVLSPAEMPPTVTRREVAALAKRGAKEGHLDSGESRILRNLFRLRTLQVRDIMTPRTVVFSLPASLTVGEVVSEHGDLLFSRIPIYHDSPDRLVGFVLRNDVLTESAADRHDVTLEELRRDLVVVPETASLSALFEQLMDQRAHIAEVVDEYGGVAGVVTLEDLIETLLGLEIVDEVDKTVDMRALARAKWEERARRLGLSLDEEGADGERKNETDP